MYTIKGLPRADFAPLFSMDDGELAQQNACRVTATGPGFPCRISLMDAEKGESLILLNHVSHDVATPYRASFAIFVREEAVDPPAWIDETPPVFAGRPMALRGFCNNGLLIDATLALPGQADERIRALFGNPQIAYIHAHNAAHGCFSARIDRA